MSENKESKNGYGVLIGAVLTVIILWTATLILLWLFPKSDERGQFGDMFGSVNALFSGLAFAFLIYTIWLQREELKLQREELKLQRKALENSVEEQRRQAVELSKTAELQAKTFDLQKQQLELSQKQIQHENIPSFVSYWRYDSNYTHHRFGIRFENIGGIAFETKISSNLNVTNYSGAAIASIKQGDSMRLLIEEEILNRADEMYIKISFKDSSKTSYENQFQIKRIDKDVIRERISQMFEIIKIN